MNPLSLKRISLGLILIAGLALATLAQLESQPVEASSRGRTGASGSPAAGGQTCNRCHNGGLTPTVTISGPENVMPGATNAYTLTIAEGQRALGGLDVEATAGALGIPEGAADVQIVSGEVTHTSPKSSNQMGEVIFSFLWTAPDASGEVTLYGAGNSVDGDTRTSGDAADTDTLVITVGDAPEPSATPPTVEPPTPTTAPPIPPPYDAVVTDLANPHGVTPLEDGHLLVGEGGTASESWQPGQFGPGAGDGRILRISTSDPSQREVLVDGMTNSMDPGGGIVGGNHAIPVQLPSANTQAASVILVAQAGGPAHARPEEAAKILLVDDAGEVEVFADPLAYEQANNPGGEEGPEGIDSNPWRLVPGPNGMVYVVDAGANDILALDLETRELSTWAVFPELFEGQQAVPTGMVFSPDDDGIAYVSLLGPFGPGETEIHRLEDKNGDGDMLDEGEHSLLVGGLKLVTDIALGPNGHLFFSQISTGTISRLDPACWSEDAACEADDLQVVADALPAVSALAFLPSGDLLATTTDQPNPGGPSLNSSMIVRIPADQLLPEPSPTDTPTPEPPSTGGRIYLPMLSNGD